METTQVEFPTALLKAAELGGELKRNCPAPCLGTFPRGKGFLGASRQIMPDAARFVYGLCRQARRSAIAIHFRRLELGTKVRSASWQLNAVADASPLIVLAKFGYLELVPTLYKPVTISLEVNAEVVVAVAGLPGASQVAKSDWIEVRQLGDSGELAAAQLQYGLDIGELSTILLATETGATTVLVDESKGRRLAQERGLEVRGTIGILENLFQRGAIPDLRAAFHRILAQGAYVSLDLLNERLYSWGLPPLRNR